MAEFTVTMRHDGDEKIHQMIAEWAEDHMQDFADRLMEINPEHTFHMRVAQEGGHPLEPQTSGD